MQIQMENVKKKKFQNKCVFGISPIATKTSGKVSLKKWHKPAVIKTNLRSQIVN